MDFSTLTNLRPAEIKTYHSKTYDRISPSKTFDARGKTLFITAGGISRIIIIQRRQSVLDAAQQSLSQEFPSLKIETHAASQSDFPRMSSIIQSSGEIDILIPCATALQPDNPTKAISTADYAEAFTVNVVAVHHLIKEFLALPSTTAAGARRKTVVNITSAGSQLPGSNGLSAYCASKTAANQMITHFATDDPEGNVKFFSLHPGAIWSPMAESARPKEAMLWEDEKLPGDVSVWLSSEEAEFVNGRYLWSQWDVDELISMKAKLAADPSLLTFSLVM